MIPDLAPHVPASLGTYRDGVAADPGGRAAMPLSALHDPAVFNATLSAFAAGLGAGSGAVDRRALVSYWSQFYLAPLATPAMTALVRLGGRCRSPSRRRASNSTGRAARPGSWCGPARRRAAPPGSRA